MMEKRRDDSPGNHRHRQAHRAAQAGGTRRRRRKWHEMMRETACDWNRYDPDYDPSNRRVAALEG